MDYIAKVKKKIYFLNFFVNFIHECYIYKISTSPSFTYHFYFPHPLSQFHDLFLNYYYYYTCTRTLLSQFSMACMYVHLGLTFPPPPTTYTHWNWVTIWELIPGENSFSSQNSLVSCTSSSRSGAL